MFKKPVGDDLSFVTWCIILLEVVIRRWYTVIIKGWTWSERDGHGQKQYSGSLWRLNDAQLVLRCATGTKVCQENIPHTITPPPA